MAAPRTMTRAARAPLLESTPDDEPERVASLASCVLNLTNTILGADVLGLVPYFSTAPESARAHSYSSVGSYRYSSSYTSAVRIWLDQFRCTGLIEVQMHLLSTCT